MKALFPAHRAAEEFAGVIDGQTRGAAADRHAPLADVVTLLRTHPQPEPRPEFVADLRDRLMRAAETDLVPVATALRTRTPAPPPIRRRERPLAAAAAALVFVGGTAGMAAAAQESVPGDALYPLKLGIEQASVALHPSDAGKGADLLGQADTRLSEVGRLIAEHAPATAISDTVHGFTSSAGQGADMLFRSYQRDGQDQDIATVRAFAHEQMTTLKALAPTAPPQTADAFQEAAATVAAIDQQARVLCAACSPDAPVAVPRALAGPPSSPSLSALIQHPVVMAEVEARRARALAAAAEAAGRAVSAAGSQLPGDTSGGGSLAAPSTGSGGTGIPTSGSSSVADLSAAVTKGTGGLTNALSDTTSKVTDGLRKTVTDATGGGGDPVGDLTGTVGDSVNGLLGGP
ncbi:MAG TPA: DUF5667 domain-containing protein [Marmoricola sp.]|nr:DUF5667 domain-containing protein [Marmoricola sp.]